MDRETTEFVCVSERERERERERGTERGVGCINNPPEM